MIIRSSTTSFSFHQDWKKKKVLATVRASTKLYYPVRAKVWVHWKFSKQCAVKGRQENWKDEGSGSGKVMQLDIACHAQLSARRQQKEQRREKTDQVSCVRVSQEQQQKCQGDPQQLPHRPPQRSAKHRPLSEKPQLVGRLHDQQWREVRHREPKRG